MHDILSPSWAIYFHSVVIRSVSVTSRGAFTHLGCHAVTPRIESSPDRGVTIGREKNRCNRKRRLVVSTCAHSACHPTQNIYNIQDDASYIFHYLAGFQRFARPDGRVERPVVPNQRETTPSVTTSARLKRRPMRSSEDRHTSFRVSSGRTRIRNMIAVTVQKYRLLSVHCIAALVRCGVARYRNP